MLEPQFYMFSSELFLPTLPFDSGKGFCQRVRESQRGQGSKRGQVRPTVSLPERRTHGNNTGAEQMSVDSGCLGPDPSSISSHGVTREGVACSPKQPVSPRV